MKNSIKLLGILALTIGAMHTQAAAGAGAAAGVLTGDQIKSYIALARRGDPSVNFIKDKAIDVPVLKFAPDKPFFGVLADSIDSITKPAVIVDCTVRIFGVEVAEGFEPKKSQQGFMIGRALMGRSFPIIFADNNLVIDEDNPLLKGCVHIGIISGTNNFVVKNYKINGKDWCRERAMPQVAVAGVLMGGSTLMLMA